jgi:hypothetical protein
LLISCGYRFRARIGVQIQVAAKIGPVIKRLDDRDIEPVLSERIANRMQKGHRIVDTRALRRQRRYRPLGTNFVVVRRARSGEKSPTRESTTWFRFARVTKSSNSSRLMAAISAVSPSVLDAKAVDPAETAGEKAGPEIL